jgi:hypothetical protein
MMDILDKSSGMVGMNLVNWWETVFTSSSLNLVILEPQKKSSWCDEGENQVLGKAVPLSAILFGGKMANPLQLKNYVQKMHKKWILTL